MQLRYEWMDELVTEVVTFIFFVLTAYKFQPAVNNPYLQLTQNDDDDDEASTALTGDRQDLAMESIQVNETDPNSADPNVTLFDLKEYTSTNKRPKNGSAATGMNHKGVLDANNVVSRAAKQQQSRV